MKRDLQKDYVPTSRGSALYVPVFLNYKCSFSEQKNGFSFSSGRDAIGGKNHHLSDNYKLPSLQMIFNIDINNLSSMIRETIWAYEFYVYIAKH